jgi:hypothetical protein
MIRLFPCASLCAASPDQTAAEDRRGDDNADVEQRVQAAWRVVVQRWHLAQATASAASSLTGVR